MIKVLEFQITPVYRLTFEKSWEACFTGFHVLVLEAVEHHGTEGGGDEAVCTFKVIGRFLFTDKCFPYIALANLFFLPFKMRYSHIFIYIYKS